MYTHDPSTKSKVSLLNNGVYATADTRVHVPVAFADKNLVTIGEKAIVIGLFNVIVGDTYFTVISPLTYTLPYTSFQLRTIDEVEYYEFFFRKGDLIIESLKVAKNALFTVELLLFIILRGQIPYYVTADTVLHIGENANKLGGINLDGNSALLELLTSLTQRSTRDTEVFYRHAPTDGVKFVPLTDVSFGTFSNFSRLLNGYQSSAMITSIVNTKLTPPSKLERTLRR